MKDDGRKILHHFRPNWVVCVRLRAELTLLNEQYDEALVVMRQQLENDAQIIDINMDEAMLDVVAAMTRFLSLIVSEPDIARVLIMIGTSKWSVIEAEIEVLCGR